MLLWLSALIAGWFENWATFRKLPQAIARSPKVVSLLGPERATRAAEMIENNVAALGGNVSLGILLGMEPVIAAFFGLPLEIRHVTLSTGQLALASWSYGAGIFAQPAFWWAIAGIGVIGFMNLTVSFGLALAVAIRSTGRGAVSRRWLAPGRIRPRAGRAAGLPVAAAEQRHALSSLPPRWPTQSDVA